MSKTLDILHDEYFEWMYNLVCKESRSYRRLFNHLHSIEFIYILDRDVRRAEDGKSLRYLFAYEYDRSNCRTLTDVLGDGPCSVLEMMVALANRCEVEIMTDPDFDDRTSIWFWDMVESLGLDEMSDDRYDEKYVNEVIDIFLQRRYEMNGKGGLFTVDNCREDMRTVEIWYQMSWYLNNLQ